MNLLTTSSLRTCGRAGVRFELSRSFESANSVRQESSTSESFHPNVKQGALECFQEADVRKYWKTVWHTLRLSSFVLFRIYRTRTPRRCGSIWHMFCALKFQGPVARLIDISNELDSRWTATNQRWSFHLTWQLLIYGRWHGIGVRIFPRFEWGALDGSTWDVALIFHWSWRVRNIVPQCPHSSFVVSR